LLKKTVPEKILAAIKELYEGGSPMSAQIARRLVNQFQKPNTDAEDEVLSKREMEIIAQLAKGFLYKEIASKLNISIGTVKQHLHRIYEKLHVQNKTEALNKFYKNKPGFYN
jgi:DNA-binding NarL/FixJ family response regulator